MDSSQRAKQVLDVLAFELRDVSIETQTLIQVVVAGLIDDAVRDALKRVSKTPEDLEQQAILLKVRKRRHT